MTFPFGALSASPDRAKLGAMGDTVCKQSHQGRNETTRRMAIRFRDRSLFLRARFAIGRDPDNDVVIDDDPLVSRHHAVIEYSAGSYVLRDLGSTNGLRVNNQALARGIRHNLADGDVITVGKTAITVTGSMLD